MPGGPWARGLPAELGAPDLKIFFSREGNPVQGNRTKARQAAARSTEQSNHKRWSWEGQALTGHSLGDSVHLPGKDRCPYFFLSQAAITLSLCSSLPGFSLGVTIYICPPE